MDWTKKHMAALGSCYDDEQWGEVFGDDESMTTADFLASDTPATDRAYIVTLMLDTNTLRQWACDMLESGEPEFPVEVDGLEDMIARTRQAVEEGKDEAWFLEEWRKLRCVPAGARCLFHRLGAVAARQAFKVAHTEDPENAEALLDLLRDRIEE